MVRIENLRLRKTRLDSSRFACAVSDFKGDADVRSRRSLFQGAEHARLACVDTLSAVGHVGPENQRSHSGSRICLSTLGFPPLWRERNVHQPIYSSVGGNGGVAGALAASEEAPLSSVPLFKGTRRSRRGRVRRRGAPVRLAGFSEVSGSC